MPRDTHAEAELLAEATPLTPRQQFEQARTLHEILRLAIDDFEAAIEDPRYVIDFSEWHRPIPAWRTKHPDLIGKTAVCLAGATMAKRLGVGIDRGHPACFEDARDQLYALSHLSIGHVAGAAELMHYWHVMDRAERFAIEIDSMEVGLSINPPVDARAVELAERWAPILWFAAGRLDDVDVWWFLACMRALQADLAEAGL
jgi:hypothetical protein